MAEDVLKALFSGKTVLCDGAMGTMLYSCGVFINRSYDELNVQQPETVRGVHEQYLQAGAEVIETNTFGANAVRLEHFGLVDKVRELNLAGAALARRCVDAHRDKHGATAYVAGAVGSLGVARNDGSALSPERMRAVFREQIAALAEGGVDLLMAETMMSVVEAEQAVAAAKQAAPGLPLAVLATVNEEGACLDGSSAAEFARRLTAAGAQAVGCNATGDGSDPGGDAECRAAAPCRGAAYLHGIAGVYGELRAEVCARRGELGGWMLWDDAGAHSRDAGKAARRPSADGGRGRDGAAQRGGAGRAWARGGRDTPG